MANDTIELAKIVEEQLNVGVGRVEVPAPSGGLLVGHRINIGSLGIFQRWSGDFGTIPASSLAVVAITVNGAALGYPVLVAIDKNLGPGQHEIDARVTAPNGVLVAIYNRSPLQPSTVGEVEGSVIVFPVPNSDSV